MAGKSINSKTKGKQRIRLPGGRSKVAVKQKRSSRVVCGVTGKPLQAVPQARSSKMQTISKSKRRPERPYGGVLSSMAARKLIIAKAREEEQ